MSQVKIFHENIVGRDFVVGDIHGCLDEFRNLLFLVGFDEQKDRIFSVGDLIDRGPKSLECLSLLGEKWFHAVRGNHEELMVHAVRNREDLELFRMWYVNGGDWSVDVSLETLTAFADKIEQLPLVICVGGDFAVIHAEFYGDDAELLSGNFSDHTQAVLQWGRSILSGNGGSKLKIKTYAGHSIISEPKKIGAIRFIDTGSFLPYRGMNGFITLCEPATGKTWRSDQ